MDIGDGISNVTDRGIPAGWLSYRQYRPELRMGR
jgi:hypothetical protein